MTAGEAEMAELLILVICIGLPIGALIALAVGGLRAWAQRRHEIRDGRRLHGGA